jgi:endonuclease/exonuclease/phosphatase family metal-dependent hydrolase
MTPATRAAGRTLMQLRTAPRVAAALAARVEDRVRRRTRDGLAPSGPWPSVDEIRVVTYNTASGNPRITTAQEDFLELPFYREALAGRPQAPILALQEVGPAQARALPRAARSGRCRVLQVRRPGQGNALVIPDRFQVLAHGRRYLLGSQVRGIADALRRYAGRRGRGRPPDWRQFGELRMLVEAELRDRASGRTFTVMNCHLSVEPSLKVAQARAVVRRARAAARRGPLVLAGDLNVPKGRARGLDLEVVALLAPFRDAGGPAPPDRPDIDYVLVSGFEPVSSRVWTGDSLQLPGSPRADLVSDHYPEDDVLRFITAPEVGPGRPAQVS